MARDARTSPRRGAPLERIVPSASSHFFLLQALPFSILFLLPAVLFVSLPFLLLNLTYLRSEKPNNHFFFFLQLHSKSFDTILFSNCSLYKPMSMDCKT